MWRTQENTPFATLPAGSARLTTVNVKVASGKSAMGRYLESASWRKIEMQGPFWGFPLLPCGKRSRFLYRTSMFAQMAMLAKLIAAAEAYQENAAMSNSSDLIFL